MRIKELIESFHKQDAKFSSYFHDIDEYNGEKKLSWIKIIILWLVILITIGVILGFP
ncbi:hypothetical protein MBCUT_05370 [Methanobrevibacter cuticularis]|uniref:Uncharacterized protein n=1 Tax=Methanobrevibacter cuticularis TaxID=47311 RepID=A0A166EMM8_9EURY|nr:hypothetical protein [Methanobrevibacter cuticularis]KZX16818.1 hypothetical protein MBCUT_05370 [Methanobrevibacter cuticularis]